MHLKPGKLVLLIRKLLRQQRHLLLERHFHFLQLLVLQSDMGIRPYSTPLTVSVYKTVIIATTYKEGNRRRQFVL